MIEQIKKEYFECKTFTEKLAYVQKSKYLTFASEGFDFWIQLNNIPNLDDDDYLIEHIDFQTYKENNLLDLLNFTGLIKQKSNLVLIETLDELFDFEDESEDVEFLYKDKKYLLNVLEFNYQIKKKGRSEICDDLRDEDFDSDYLTCLTPSPKDEREIIKIKELYDLFEIGNDSKFIGNDSENYPILKIAYCYQLYDFNIKEFHMNQAEFGPKHLISKIVKNDIDFLVPIKRKFE